MKRLLLYLIILVSLTGKAQTFTGRVTDKSGNRLCLPPSWQKGMAALSLHLQGLGRMDISR